VHKAFGDPQGGGALQRSRDLLAGFKGADSPQGRTGKREQGRDKKGGRRERRDHHPANSSWMRH